MVTLEKAFGEVLQEIRQERGLSQEQLGFESGYHRTYISLLERGKKNPSLNAIFRLANALKINPADILRRVEVRVAEIPHRERREHDL
ncbi:MAG: helix-turn-helix transcriptional regulator [Pseudomonadota bacterium]